MASTPTALTPLIAAWLVAKGGGSLWLVATYNVLVAAVSLVSARFLPETRGRDLDAPTAGPGTRAGVDVLQPASAG